MFDKLDKKLFAAVEANDVKQINALIEQGADIYADDGCGATLLERAKTAEVAEALIANGASLKNDECESELFYVDIPEVVEALIAHGADVNDKLLPYGETPLFMARSAAVAEMLIAHGADVNATAMNGETPLSRTCSAEVAKVLIEHGADVNARLPHGETPLFKTRSAEVAKVLIEHGADVNAVNDYGIPMINYAAPEIADVVRTCLHGKMDAPNKTKKD